MASSSTEILSGRQVESKTLAETLLVRYEQKKGWFLDKDKETLTLTLYDIREALQRLNPRHKRSSPETQP
jgi:hypothetical protein